MRRIKWALLIVTLGLACGQAARTPVPETALNFTDVKLSAMDMTELQWQDYRASLKYRQVSWQGVVLNVKEDGTSFSNPYVEVDIIGSSPGLDVYLYVTEDNARRLRIGDHILFEGEVRDLYELFGRWTVLVDSSKVESRAEASND